MTGVAIEASGAGPAVLLLHGTPTDWDLLRPIAQRTQGRRTLLAALPGYGNAPAWPSPPNAAGIVEAIEEALLDVGVRRLSIVGFSGGAHHALHLAVRGVVHVENVVALGCLADLSLEERSGMKGMAAALRRGASFAGVPTTRFLAPKFAASHPQACCRVEAWLSATSPSNLALELEAFADAPPLLDQLSRFEGRVLARTGALDLATPPAHAVSVAQACSRGVAQIVERCGHALLEEDFEPTIAATLAFLR
jgi:pimeloyl-ACP methyl ester carboxylesterase